MRATPPPAISCFMPWDFAPAFQQVDRAPDTKTGTECHDESLQYTDCAVEKCHTEASFKFPLREWWVYRCCSDCSV